MMNTIRSTQNNAGSRPVPAWETELSKLKLDPKTREAVHSAVAGAASYKGYPWSQTEFCAASAMTRDSLCEKHGEEAGKAFDRVLAKVPVRGGRFNPWSGD